jgi:non-ribosomal peptide synthetase component F
MSMVRRLAPVVAIALLVAACHEATVPDVLPLSGRAQVSFPDGLTQTVTITPSAPRTMANLVVRSAVVNLGTAPVSLESRVCGLDFQGTLLLQGPPGLAQCAAYSMSGTLAPGDSLVQSEPMQLLSPAGRYELLVRQVVTPSHWVTVPVTVVAP